MKSCGLYGKDCATSRKHCLAAADCTDYLMIMAAGCEGYGEWALTAVLAWGLNDRLGVHFSLLNQAQELLLPEAPGLKGNVDRGSGAHER